MKSGNFGLLTVLCWTLQSCIIILQFKELPAYMPEELPFRPRKEVASL